MFVEIEGLAADMKPSLSTQLIDEESALPQLAAEWDALVSKSSGTIFQTYDWQFLWWKHFASKPQYHLIVVLIREKERLIGIAPFFLQSHTMIGFRIFRQLKLIGSGLQSKKSPVLSLEREGPGDYLDVIAERGCEDKVADSVSDFLKNNDYLWDEIEFQNLPEDSILLNSVLPRMEAPEVEIAKKATDVCPRVTLPQSIDEYLASLRIKVRRNLRHSYRAYFENPEYSLEEIGAKGNVDGALQILSLLHQKRWSAIGYPGLFSDQRFEAMQRDLVKALSNKGRIWMKILRHQGKPVAARLAFVYNGQVCDYLSGIDRTQQSGSASYSGAGMAVILCIIKQAIESKYRIFDLARGDEAYKFDLTSDVPKNYYVTIRANRNNGHQRFFAYRISSAKYSLLSRIACESGIFKLIAKENGSLLAIPKYIGHVAKRLSKGSLTFYSISGINKLSAVFAGKSKRDSEKQKDKDAS
jgi:CelD/BcsL family acetyltransferase involved in cellulose biosynthesis